LATLEQIQLRGGTAAEWAAANPVLLAREIGIETDTLRVKIGDAATAWNTLPYATDRAGRGAAMAVAFRWR
jgi:hypothetical protein